mmetsp:Transcript_19406/g.65057  ORF Transcript_19406/g.65057 Transcript_19406/m.65057 type:complete len:517 (+) Transcript_19406:373-1923(+)
MPPTQWCSLCCSPARWRRACSATSSTGTSRTACRAPRPTPTTSRTCCASWRTRSTCGRSCCPTWCSSWLPWTRRPRRPRPVCAGGGARTGRTRAGSRTSGTTGCSTWRTCRPADRRAAWRGARSVAAPRRAAARSWTPRATSSTSSSPSSSTSSTASGRRPRPPRRAPRCSPGASCRPLTLLCCPRQPRRGTSTFASSWGSGPAGSTPRASWGTWPRSSPRGAPGRRAPPCVSPARATRRALPRPPHTSMPTPCSSRSRPSCSAPRAWGPPWGRSGGRGRPGPTRGTRGARGTPARAPPTSSTSPRRRARASSRAAGGRWFPPPCAQPRRRGGRPCWTDCAPWWPWTRPTCSPRRRPPSPPSCAPASSPPATRWKTAVRARARPRWPPSRCARARARARACPCPSTATPCPSPRPTCAPCTRPRPRRRPPPASSPRTCSLAGPGPRARSGPEAPRPTTPRRCAWECTWGPRRWDRAAARPSTTAPRRRRAAWPTGAPRPRRRSPSPARARARARRP